MEIAKKPENEKERLAELRATGLLDTAPEAEFDHIVGLASLICQTPIALVSLVDENRQWFKAKKGLSACETSRDFAFCAHAILGEEPFIVENADTDQRFHDNPLVTGGPHVKFYAGYPLSTPKGLRIGTLCVIDSVPRTLNEEQKSALQMLSEQTVKLIQLRTLLEEQTSVRHAAEIESQKLEMIANNIASVIWISRADKSEISFVSSAYEKIWGQSKGTLYNNATSFLDPVHPEDRERLIQAFPRQLEGTYDEKYRIIVNGVTKWIHDRAYPIKNPDGGITQIVGIARDITADVIRENLIREEKEKFETIVNNIPIMLGMFDSDGNFDWTNREWKNVLGWSEQDVKKESLLTLFYPDPKVRAKVVEFMTSDDKSWKTFKTATKSGASIETSWANVHLSSGKSIGIGKNVEHEKQQQKIILDQQAKIIGSAKLSSLGEMASGIAHEINNPLSVILGMAGNLRKRIEDNQCPTEKLTKGLMLIESTAERIAKIVRSLRTYSRSGDKDPFVETFFSTIIQDTLTLCSERFRKDNIRMNVHCPDDFSIQCRSVQLVQVLVNLLNNSYDAIHGQESPWIEVHIYREGNAAKISVEDSGGGIPFNVQQEIMTPFFTTKEVGKGTGLGLSISKSIAEDHRGSLQYVGDEKNTKFLVSLPLSH